MKYLVTLIKYDYLQRIRSYTFLITLCASIAIGYTFVPSPNANYSTIRIAEYVGEYNSAWFGYVTAIMTSLFLSLIGFYLVNGTIRTDGQTKVGQIFASTKVTNFKYLFIKVITNFFVLLTLTAVIFVMSLVLFFMYNDGFEFEIMAFIKPYVFISLPALFFISVLAVLFEVVFGRFTVLQNVLFFFCFCALSFYTPKTQLEYGLDVFGQKIVVHHLEEKVKEIKGIQETGELTIGYIISSKERPKKFEFNGFDFPSSFIISRFIWLGLGFVLILGIASFFHRFDTKEKIQLRKPIKIVQHQSVIRDINVNNLPKTDMNFSLLPIIKIELLLLFRKGKKWLWLVNALGMILMVSLSLRIAHQMVLPILWFIQVHRLSDITVKEVNHNMQYLTFSSLAPLKRLLGSQLISAIIVMLTVALPLVVRYAVLGDLQSAIVIVLGGIFLVLLSAIMGLISKGKKLFEVVFFLVTYANINAIPFLDYFGGVVVHLEKTFVLCIIVVLLLMSTIWIRKRQLTKL